MKVVVVSDSHGAFKDWMKIEPFLQDADLIWHLGDVLYHGPRNPLPEGYDPARLAERLKSFSIDYVRGNCDADVDAQVLGLPEMSRVIEETIGNMKIVMVHGDMLQEDDEEEFAKYHRASILLRGHTHIPKVQKREGVLVVNPGSISLPKGGSEKSFAVLYFDEPLIVEIRNIDGDVIMREVLWI